MPVLYHVLRATRLAWTDACRGRSRARFGARPGWVRQQEFTEHLRDWGFCRADKARLPRDAEAGAWTRKRTSDDRPGARKAEGRRLRPARLDPLLDRGYARPDTRTSSNSHRHRTKPRQGPMPHSVLTDLRSRGDISRVSEGH